MTKPKEPRYQKEGPKWIERFLESLADTLSIEAACQTVDISRVTARETRQRYQWFADEWDKVMKLDFLVPFRASLARRATYGNEKPIWKEVEVRGEDGRLERKEWQIVGYEVEYETALTKMVAERRLEEYKDDHAGDEDANIIRALKFREALNKMLDTVPHDKEKKDE